MELSTTTYAAAALVIGAIGYSFKEILAALTLMITRRINKNIRPEKHAVFTLVNKTRLMAKYKQYSNNPFKQEVIKTREEVFWTLMEVECNHLLNIKDNFDTEVKQAMQRVCAYPDKLLAAGMSSKTVTVMEGTVAPILIFIMAMCENILKDELYDTNEERLWAIFNVVSEYAAYAHLTAIESLAGANGQLLGETFNGITNA